MGTLRLPPEVEAVFREFRTCEFTTVNRQGQPLTWPTEPFYDAPEGRLIVTASIAFPVKAFNARRHPQVAVLFSDPMGAPLTNPPAVLVQGEATVTELVDDPPWSYAMFKESIQHQPRAQLCEQPAGSPLVHLPVSAPGDFRATQAHPGLVARRYEPGSHRTGVQLCGMSY